MRRCYLSFLSATILVVFTLFTFFTMAMISPTYAKPLSAKINLEVTKTIDIFFKAMKEKDIVTLQKLLLNKGVSYEYLKNEGKWVENLNSEYLKGLKSTKQDKFLAYDLIEKSEIKITGSNNKMTIVTGKLSIMRSDKSIEKSDFVMILCFKEKRWYIQTFNKDQSECYSGEVKPAHKKNDKS